jgi:4-amino-4-deoxy-L-arabinose transferase-like glycosyltransferase
MLTNTVQGASFVPFLRKDWVFVGSFFVVVLLSRVPFASQYLFYSDSTRFALAMEHFDVSQMRPQAPGYILYVASAKLVDLVLHNAAQSLVGVSMVANALTVCVLYLLAFKMFGRSNAVVSAVLLATSPLFWYNGEMALAYALEGFLSASFAYACYMELSENRRWTAVAAAVLLAAAAGTRQNSVVLLAPIWIIALWKMPVKRALVSILVFGICCSFWFVPLVLFSGGLRNYLQTLQAQFQAVIVEPLPLLMQMKIRSGILVRFLLYSFVLGLAPLIYFVGKFFQITAILKDRRVRFILLWIAPSICFYILVTLWNPGHVIIILPPLVIFLSESLLGFSRELSEIWNERSIRIPGGRPFTSSQSTVAVLMTTITAATNIAVFALAHTPISYASIKAADQQLADMISLTKEKADPDKTIVLATQLNTQAAYYLPEYIIYCPFPLIFDQSKVPLQNQNVYVSHKRQTLPKTYWTDTNFTIKPIDIPASIGTLIVWEPEIAGYFKASDRPLAFDQRSGSDTGIYSIPISENEKFYYGFHWWSLK